MSEPRAQLFAAIRRGLKRGAPSAADRAAVEACLQRHEVNLLPARAQKSGEELIALFRQRAEKVSTTTERIADLSQIPGAVARYLKAQNLPAEIKLAPAPMLTQLDWAGAEPLLKVSAGASDGQDRVSLTPAFAAIGETGTLMLISGAETPTTLNFLPEYHLVVVPISRLVGSYEAALGRLREAVGAGAMPRTVNLVTGPSRSADIGHIPQLGAHGPRRLHVILVDDETPPHEG